MALARYKRTLAVLFGVVAVGATALAWSGLSLKQVLNALFGFR